MHSRITVYVDSSINTTYVVRRTLHVDKWKILTVLSTHTYCWDTNSTDSLSPWSWKSASNRGCNKNWYPVFAYVRYGTVRTPVRGLRAESYPEILMMRNPGQFDAFW